MFSSFECSELDGNDVCCAGRHKTQGCGQHIGGRRRRPPRNVPDLVVTENYRLLKGRGMHFNQNVEDAIAEVSARLKKVNPDDLGERRKLWLQKAMSAAKERMSLIARRQKLLKLTAIAPNGACGTGRRKEGCSKANGQRALDRGHSYRRGDSSALQPVGKGQLQQLLALPVVRPRLTGLAVSTFSCLT